VRAWCDQGVDFGVVARRLRRTQPVQLTRRRQGYPCLPNHR